MDHIGRLRSREGCPITEAFQVLPKEKQAVIFRAAAAEFAEHGYKQASTNRIVRTAGIGKGMLFYYFGSKLELYHDLLDQVGEMIDRYCEKLRVLAKGAGMIETIWHATRVKMEAYLENPELFDFLTRLYLHPEDAAVSERTQETFARFSKLRERVLFKELLAQADQSKLRRDVPPERLTQYLNFTIAGYSQHITDTIKANVSKASDLDWKPWLDEFDTVVEDLKILFYD